MSFSISGGGKCFFQYRSGCRTGGIFTRFPSALITIWYFALFPFTVVLGLIHRPKTWVFWFIRWDALDIPAWWGIFLVPFLELWGLFWCGWNWTNLGHLFGLVCGVGVVLLLPTKTSMNRSSRSVFSGA